MTRHMITASQTVTDLDDFYVLLDDQRTESVRYYSRPIEIIQALTPEEVAPAFEKLQRAHDQGYDVAGYSAYELGYILEPKLTPLYSPTPNTPLLKFGVFKGYDTHMPAHMRYTATPPRLALRPAWSLAEYTARFENVMAYIRSGDVYQINLTFPIIANYDGTAATLYAALRQRQNASYGGIVHLGGPDIVTLSPELFFKKDGRHMTLRPMKGTRPRRMDPVKDLDTRNEMLSDIKSRAENLMIVDLLRNDLSRVALPGTVKVPDLFTLETYPTLHQMTSRITGTLKDGVQIYDLFKSLFPCGSVTGAPKIRAMEVIAELEANPRGAYCGAIGYFDSTGEACFNVAIRSAILDGATVRYDVGSGLVLDSDAQDEYDECQLKAGILNAPPEFLIETLRWEPDSGFLRLPAHLGRLEQAAKDMDYTCHLPAVETALKAKTTHLDGPQRVQIKLARDGHVQVNVTPYIPKVHPIKVAVSRYALEPSLQTSRHKVSHRDFYDGERARIQALNTAEEVLFFNAQGEMCEGSFTNIFIEKDGRLLTPHLSCGLLNGILRQTLISDGTAVEAALSLADIHTADTLYVGNALRGLIAAQLVSPDPV